MSDPIRIFEPFVYKQTRYLAVRRDNGVHIVDETGANYGSYHDIKSFKKFVDKGESLNLGKCQLSVRVLS